MLPNPYATFFCLKPQKNAVITLFAPYSNNSYYFASPSSSSS